MGRKKLYADDAARKAAFREKIKRIEIAVNPKLGETLDKVAEHFDVSLNELCNSLIRQALTDGDIYKRGLYQYK